MSLRDIATWRVPLELPHHRWLARQERWLRFVLTVLITVPIGAAVTMLMGDPPSQHLGGIIGGAIGCAVAAAWLPASAS